MAATSAVSVAFQECCGFDMLRVEQISYDGCIPYPDNLWTSALVSSVCNKDAAVSMSNDWTYSQGIS